MGPYDLQQVLDRLIEWFQYNASPQLLRRAVDYARFESANPKLPSQDPDEAKSWLAQRAQGFIHGYAAVLDGMTFSPSRPPLSCSITSQALDELIREHGDDSSADDIAGAAAHMIVVVSLRPEGCPEGLAAVVARTSAEGYLDGAFQARADMDDRRPIRRVDAGLARGILGEIADNLADEPIEECLREDLLDGMEQVISLLVDPKSGVSLDSDSTIIECCQLYILGYLIGAGAGADGIVVEEVASDIEGIVALPREQRSVLSLLVLWGAHMGYSDAVIVDAANWACSIWSVAVDKALDGEGGSDDGAGNSDGMGGSDGTGADHVDATPNAREERSAEGDPGASDAVLATVGMGSGSVMYGIGYMDGLARRIGEEAWADDGAGLSAMAQELDGIFDGIDIE